MFDPGPGQEERKGLGEPSERQQLYNNRNRVVLWGSGGRPGAGSGCRGLVELGSRQPEAASAPAWPPLVCACQAVPVLPARAGCELVDPAAPHSPQRGWLVLARVAGGEQGPASPWDIRMVTSWLPRRLLCHVCASCGHGEAGPCLGAEGNVCACVLSVCLCTRGTI